MTSLPVSYREPSRLLDVLDHADVLVLGGGPGGLGAAIAAARNGARTILVERTGTFGGNWTLGILGAIMPCPYGKGIFVELVDRLKKDASWLICAGFFAPREL
jgi:NADPH-dependent 2,4-dienoyl-CoA reductase/sulfur reductase-like enzyme